MNKTNAVQTMNPETGTPFSRAELKEAFERVQNKDNWKMPIDAVVARPYNLEMIWHAVIFFAGCKPEFSAVDGSLAVRVKAEGYYMAVGA